MAAKSRMIKLVISFRAFISKLISYLGIICIFQQAKFVFFFFHVSQWFPTNSIPYKAVGALGRMKQRKNYVNPLTRCQANS